MPTWPNYKALQAIAQGEFADVVISTQIISLPTGDPHKLRRTLTINIESS